MLFGPFTEWYVLRGTTSSSADTALGTLPTNPAGRADVYAWPISGAGVYIEDSGADNTWVSGILAASIDVRSTNTSEPFKVIVAVVGGETPKLAT